MLEISILCNKLLHINEDTEYTKIKKCKNVIKLKKDIGNYLFKSRCKLEKNVRGAGTPLEVTGN
jgi:hypothetical protein